MKAAPPFGKWAILTGGFRFGAFRGRMCNFGVRILALMKRAAIIFPAAFTVADRNFFSPLRNVVGGSFYFSTSKTISHEKVISPLAERMAF
jgi:hypothetical protein